MAITPSGKIRVMVAQSFSSPLSEGFSQDSIQEQQSSPMQEEGAVKEFSPPQEMDTEDALNEDVGGDVPSPDNSSGEIEPKENKKTLSNYIFKKLESWGYPGRRLQEFKTKFVRESVSADGIKDVQVEIPDKKYPGPQGVADTVENDDLKQISQEVSEYFGLNFNGAERSDGKWTIKFTSQKMTDPEEGMSHDNLDEVYGTPSAGKGKKQPIGTTKSKMAYTQQEMFNQSKEAIVKKLMNRTGA